MSTIDLVSELEQFARMSIAKRSMHSLAQPTSGQQLSTGARALVDFVGSGTAHTKVDINYIWDDLNWAEGLGLATVVLPVADKPTPGNKLSAAATNMAVHIQVSSQKTCWACC